MSEKLPYIVSSLDGIDNADAYDEFDGGFRLRPDALNVDLPDGYSIENVQGLQSSLHNVRKERDDAQKTLRSAQEKLKDVEGLDVKRARELMEKFSKGELTPAAQAEEVRRSLQEEFAAREKDYTTKLSRMERSIVDMHRDSEFSSACAALGANAKLLAGAKMSIKTELVEDDEGNIRPQNRVVDARGETLYSRKPGQPGTPMSVEEYLERLREDKDYAAAFPKPQGGGGKGVTRAGRQRFEGLQGVDKLAAYYGAQSGS